MASLPDKWVRKAFYDRIHNIEVNSELIKCFDTRTLKYDGDFYTILGTQTNIEENTKCGNGWISTIIIEVFTRYRKNTGSRTMADDIIDEILTECADLALEPASGMKISHIERSTPNDITDVNSFEVVHRKFLRYVLEIN